MSIWAPLFSNQSILDAIFAQIFMEFWKVLRDFARILKDFNRILKDLPGFSPNQNFWGCGCTPAHRSPKQVPDKTI